MGADDAQGRIDLRRLWSEDAPDIGLGRNDFLVAAAVSDIGRPAAMSEVADALASVLGEPMRAATAYATVKKLRRLGLVAKTGTLRSPSGGRPQAVLALTERGALALRVGAGMAEALADPEAGTTPDAPTPGC